MHTHPYTDILGIFLSISKFLNDASWLFCKMTTSSWFFLFFCTILFGAGLASGERAIRELAGGSIDMKGDSLYSYLPNKQNKERDPGKHKNLFSSERKEQKIPFLLPNSPQKVRTIIISVPDL
jgi:hypothetical protein